MADKVKQISDRQLAKMRRQAERAHEKEQWQQDRQCKEVWMVRLQEMPVGRLLKHTTAMALPDTKKEGLVEGGLILGTAAVTYVATAALTPALVGAGVAVASMGAYNIWRKNRGELQELTTRVFSYGAEMPKAEEE